jgi:hypothetical protein
MKKPKVIWGPFRQLIRSLCVFWSNSNYLILGLKRLSSLKRSWIALLLDGAIRTRARAPTIFDMSSFALLHGCHLGNAGLRKQQKSTAGTKGYDLLVSVEFRPWRPL